MNHNHDVINSMEGNGLILSFTSGLFTVEP